MRLVRNLQLILVTFDWLKLNGDSKNRRILKMSENKDDMESKHSFARNNF